MWNHSNPWALLTIHRCLWREGTSKQLKHKLTIADYPTISQLFMFYDREQKGALGYFNIAEMLEDFNIKPDKIAIKGILNYYFSITITKSIQDL